MLGKKVKVKVNYDNGKKYLKKTLAMMKYI